MMYARLFRLVRFDLELQGQGQMMKMANLIESLLLGVRLKSRGRDLVIFRLFPMLYNGAMQNEWRGPETCLIWHLELRNIFMIFGTYMKSCVAIIFGMSDLTLKIKVKVKWWKWPITCWIWLVELGNALDTYKKSCITIDIDWSDLTLRLKVKVKCRKMAHNLLNIARRASLCIGHL